MRIAQVAPYGVDPYSGVLTVVVRLSTELARRGHQVEVWQLHTWPENETRDLVVWLSASGVGCVRVPGVGSPWGLPARARAMIATRAVDLVHVHNAFSPQNNALAASLAVPYVVSPHGAYAPGALRRHRWRKRLFLRLRDRPLLRRAAAIFALSEAERDDLARLGIDERIAVIPHGVDAPPSGLDPSAFRRELGISGAAKLALFLGRLDVHYKRLDALVRGIAEAGNWALALVGPDWNGSEARLRALIAQLGAGDRVFLVGPRRGFACWEALAAADVFTLLSRAEGFPMALLEGLASGVPAVVSAEVERVTGVVERGAGWLVDPARIVEHLRQLQTVSPHEWNLKRQAGLRLAAELDWRRVAARYEPILERSISRRLLR